MRETGFCFFSVSYPGHPFLKLAARRCLISPRWEALSAFQFHCTLSNLFKHSKPSKSAKQRICCDMRGSLRAEKAVQRNYCGCSEMITLRDSYQGLTKCPVGGQIILSWQSAGFKNRWNSRVLGVCYLGNWLSNAEPALWNPEKFSSSQC